MHVERGLVLERLAAFRALEWVMSRVTDQIVQFSANKVNLKINLQTDKKD